MSHEHNTSPESPNQPFHDLLSEFGTDILEAVREPLRETGMVGYPTELLRAYEQKIDQLLAERDM